MKKCITCALLFLLLACSANAVTVTNWIVDEWCTNSAWATNPYGNWTYKAGYNGNRALPYMSLTNFVDAFAWGWKRWAWYNLDTGDAPIAALDYYSGNPDDDCAEIQTCTNGINTSVGWIAPNAGTVEKIFVKWKTKSGGNATNASNVYIDHTRGDTIVDTKYTFTNDYIHGYWDVATIDYTTPFTVLAGDVIYVSFVRRSDDAPENNLIYGSRWGNNSYILFTPVPEPGMFIAALAGLGLFLRRK
jgi:hypothetical protein